MDLLAFASAGASIAPQSLRSADTKPANVDGLAPKLARSYGAAPTWLIGSTSAVATATSMVSGVKARRARARKYTVACRDGAEAAARPVTLSEVAPKASPPPRPFDPALQLGVTEPLGYFDPLGLWSICKTREIGDERSFHKLRCAELKHGRVAMLATVGMVFQHYVQLPGFQTVPSGVKAALDPMGLRGELLLLSVVAYLELVAWKDDISKEPGNFGDPANLASGLDGHEVLQFSYNDEMRNKELNNGRVAMISIAGIIVAELSTGRGAIQQFGLDLPHGPGATVRLCSVDPDLCAAAVKSAAGAAAQVGLT